MARKSLDLVIEDEGRDKGKRFHITEMSADAGERFAFRALLAAAATEDASSAKTEDASSAKTEDASSDANASSAKLGLTDILKRFAKISYYDLEPLLDELMLCVQACPDKTNPAIRRPLIAEDTEEILTRMRLKKAAFDLNFVFFMDALSQTFTSMTP